MFLPMRDARRDIYDVAVVGGGATGFAAAIAAARAGARTMLFAPPATFAAGRTAALLQGSIDLLSELGIWASVSTAAAPLRAIRIVDGTRRLIRAPEATFHASEVGLPAFGYNVPNGTLVDAMQRVADGLDGLSLIDLPAQALKIADRQVTIETATESVSARLVVAADGARSLAREAAGISVRSWSYPQAALVATLAIQHPHGGVSTEIHTENGPFTLVPLPGDRVSLVWVDRPDRAEAAAALDGDAFSETAERRAYSLHGAMRVDSPPAVFPLKAALAERLAAHRTILVGEAAHLFPPIGAQGLNLGFRDVAALQMTLGRYRSDPGGPDALKAYHAARQADVRTRTFAVDLLNRSLLTDFLPVQAARGIGLALATHVPLLRRVLIRQGLAAGSHRNRERLGPQPADRDA